MLIYLEDTAKTVKNAEAPRPCWKVVMKGDDYEDYVNSLAHLGRMQQNLQDRDLRLMRFNHQSVCSTQVTGLTKVRLKELNIASNSNLRETG